MFDDFIKLLRIKRKPNKKQLYTTSLAKGIKFRNIPIEKNPPEEYRKAGKGRRLSIAAYLNSRIGMAVMITKLFSQCQRPLIVRVPAWIQVALCALGYELCPAYIGKSPASVRFSGINFYLYAVFVSGIRGSAGYNPIFLSDDRADSPFPVTLACIKLT